MTGLLYTLRGYLSRGADGLIIGSPNYLSEMTASFRALYERLIFQNLTYNLEQPCCNEHPARVLLIMTSNAPDTGYVNLVRGYQQTLNRFVGPTETLVSGNTLAAQGLQQDRLALDDIRPRSQAAPARDRLPRRVPESL